MAALKAMTQWFPLDKLPLVNGIVVASGGVGALVATAPTEWAVEAIGWRAVFFVLAGATVVAAVIIFAVVPDRKRTTDTPEETLGQAMGKLGVIFKSRAFWRIAPAVARGASWRFRDYGRGRGCGMWPDCPRTRRHRCCCSLPSPWWPGRSVLA
jgi:MFS family permease